MALLRKCETYVTPRMSAAKDGLPMSWFLFCCWAEARFHLCVWAGARFGFCCWAVTCFVFVSGGMPVFLQGPQT